MSEGRVALTQLDFHDLAEGGAVGRSLADLALCASNEDEVRRLPGIHPSMQINVLFARALADVALYSTPAKITKNKPKMPRDREHQRRGGG